MLNGMIVLVKVDLRPSVLNDVKGSGKTQCVQPWEPLGESGVPVQS